MDISKLWDKYKGETIYILGTGPSVRCFPNLDKILSGKLTIGLNEAYKHWPCSYNLTIHPRLIPKDLSPGGWVIKPKDEYADIDIYDERFYIFQNNHDIHNYDYIKKTKGCLYVGRGIQTGAMTLAAQMGASVIVLIGCDFAQLGPDHHSHVTHIEFHQFPPEDVYKEYYLNSAILRTKLKDIYKTEIISLQPFLGLGYQDIEYRRITAELDLPCLPTPKDKSKYKRNKIDF